MTSSSASAGMTIIPFMPWRMNAWNSGNGASPDSNAVSKVALSTTPPSFSIHSPRPASP